MKINLVILAAGNSSRFPTNKLLYKFHGKPMIQYTLEKGLQLPFHKRIIVTQYEEIEEFAKDFHYQLIRNKNPEEGISQSMKLGLKQCMDSDYTMFLVADQPYLKVSTLQAMMKHCDNKHIICASYQGQYRNPILFPSNLYKELFTLQGDKGGSQLLHRYKHNIICIACDKEEIEDIDTIEDVKVFGFTYKT